MALVWGGNMYAWDSVHTLASLLIGVVILVIFGLYEWKGTNRGLLDHRLFENRNFAILLAVAFVDGLLLFGILVFVPQEVASVWVPNFYLVTYYNSDHSYAGLPTMQYSRCCQLLDIPSRPVLGASQLALSCSLRRDIALSSHPLSYG